MSYSLSVERENNSWEVIINNESVPMEVTNEYN
jgi:hypothetical protein